MSAKMSFLGNFPFISNFLINRIPSLTARRVLLINFFYLNFFKDSLPEVRLWRPGLALCVVVLE